MDVSKALNDFQEEVQKLKEALGNLKTLKKSVESTEKTIREKNSEKKKLIDKRNDAENPPAAEEKDELRRKINELEKDLERLEKILKDPDDPRKGLKAELDNAEDLVKILAKAVAEAFGKLQQEIARL